MRKIITALALGIFIWQCPVIETATAECDSSKCTAGIIDVINPNVSVLLESVEETEVTQTSEPYVENVTKKVTVENHLKSYMRYDLFNRASKQYALQQMAHTNEIGLRMVDDRYCVALGTAFTNQIGQQFDLVLENGQTIPCVLGDVKADIHTDTTNTYTLSNGCVSEFLIDEDALIYRVAHSGDVSYAYEEWDSSVVAIVIYDCNVLN